MLPVGQGFRDGTWPSRQLVHVFAVAVSADGFVVHKDDVRLGLEAVAVGAVVVGVPVSLGHGMPPTRLWRTCRNMRVPAR